MGSGIAQWCAARGYRVVMRDVQPEFVARGLAVIKGLFDEAAQRGKMSAAAAAEGTARVQGTTNLAQGLANIRLAERAAARQLVEDAR